jgi:hypothetical protein
MFITPNQMDSVYTYLSILADSSKMALLLFITFYCVSPVFKVKFLNFYLRVSPVFVAGYYIYTYGTAAPKTWWNDVFVNDPGTTIYSIDAAFALLCFAIVYFKSHRSLTFVDTYEKGGSWLIRLIAVAELGVIAYYWYTHPILQSNSLPTLVTVGGVYMVSVTIFISMYAYKGVTLIPLLPALATQFQATLLFLIPDLGINIPSFSYLLYWIDGKCCRCRRKVDDIIKDND